MRIKILCLLLIACTLTSIVSAQSAYRIHADILTKTRLPDSTFQISKGQLYYDHNFKKIVFDFTFPQKEQVVLYDTLMFTFRDDTLHLKNKNLVIPKQSFYHYMLSGQMANYGLENSNFKPQKVNRKDGMVITTWIPPEQLAGYISRILVATKQKKLYSVTMVDDEGNVKNRQILKKYESIDGVDIPTEVLMATYYDSGTVYQIISLKNIKLNEFSNDEIYDYKL